MEIIIFQFLSLTFTLIFVLNIIKKIKNTCKKKIKDFTLKVNKQRYDIINNIDKLEENMLINVIIGKYPCCNPNFKINKDDDNELINIKFHNYSLIFTPNIINEFTNMNDIYKIYHENSTHIPEPGSKKLLIKEENFYNENNPDVLYKINSHDELSKFIMTYNSKRFLFLELDLYDIIIDKYDKSYKTTKTTFYIKYCKNKFLELFHNIKEYHFEINDENNLIVLNSNNKEIMKIDYYYTDDKSILDNNITYTHMNINEYNGFYY